MPPSLRNRVWYERYLRSDELTHQPSSFRKQLCFKLPNNSKGRCNGNRQQWRHQTLHCRRSDDIKDISFSYFSNTNLSKKIKEEVVDDQHLDKKHIIPLVNAAGKGQGRMLLRDWLEANADDGCMSGLKWLDKELGLVQISWKHGSRAGWSRSDVEVFESWALHTGKFNPNKSDWKRWKANFRCALNSLSDVIEIKEIGNTRSSNPYKVYRILPPHDTSKHAKSKRMKTAEFVQSKFLVKPEKLDLQIKMEPISPDDSSFGWDEGNRKNVETISSSSLTDEIKAWNSELSLREDDLYNRPTLHQPTNFAESFQIDENQPEKVLDCSWHCDHSYSNTSKHLADQEKVIVEPELIDGHDLISTINEEFEKFCASNIYMDLWGEEKDKEEFALHDFNNPSYFEESIGVNYGNE